MPELPEVETVRRELSEELSSKNRQSTLLGFTIYQKQLRVKVPEKKLRALIGLKILSVCRRAKYLLFETEKGHIISHLGMTGRWHFSKEKTKHDHLSFDLSDGRRLFYQDIRRFGWIEFSEDYKQSKWYKKLGPEPLEAESFNAEYLFKKSRKRKVPIKAFIMNQEIVVGVGNIYASEALFRAGVSPKIFASKITREQANKIVEAIEFVLQSSIEIGGTTIRNYASTRGNKGSFVDMLMVYGRAGQKCKKCETPIRQIQQVGRSTFWCLSCQK